MANSDLNKRIITHNRKMKKHNAEATKLMLRKDWWNRDMEKIKKEFFELEKESISIREARNGTKR